MNAYNEQFDHSPWREEDPSSQLTVSFWRSLFAIIFKMTVKITCAQSLLLMILHVRLRQISVAHWRFGLLVLGWWCVFMHAHTHVRTHRSILILCFIAYDIITIVKTGRLKRANYKIRKCLCFSQHCNEKNGSCWENWGKCGGKIPSIQVWGKI